MKLPERRSPRLASILKLEEAVGVVDRARAGYNVIGLCQGAIDVSDLALLRRMEEIAFQADFLVAAIPLDASSKERADSAIRCAQFTAGLEHVDAVVLYPPEKAAAVRDTIVPDVFLSLSPDAGPKAYSSLPADAEPFDFSAASSASSRKSPSTLAAPIKEMELPEFRMAQSMRQKGDTAQAIALLHKARFQQPENLQILCELGLCQRLSGDHQGSAASFSEAVRLAPRSETLHHLLGLSWRDLGHFENAVQAFRTAIEIRNDVPEFHQDLGITLKSMGQLKAAAESFRCAVDRRPADPVILHQLALAQFDAGLLEPALETSENAIRLHPANEALHHLKGLCLRRLGRLVEAAAAFQGAIDINPNVITFFHDLAGTLRDLNDHDGVIAMMENIIRLTPDDPNSYIQIADAHQKKGEHYKALRWIKRYLRERDPENLAVWLALGHCLRELGHLDEAVRVYLHIGEMAEAKPERATDYAGVLAAACEYRGDPVGAAHWLEAERIRWEEQAQDALRQGIDDPHVITFGPLNGSIGDLAMRFDLYVKAAKLGLTDGHDAIVLAPPEYPFVNPAFIDYWRPYLRFEHDPAAVARLRHVPWGFQSQLQEVRLKGSHYRFFPSVYAWTTQVWEEEGRPPLLRVSEADCARGWRTLERMGMKEGDWFVCLHVRDGGYYRESETGCNSLSLHRSARVETYIPAIEHIIDRGGWVIRLGDRSAAKLNWRRRGFIDYAWSDERSDWMDVFLMGCCRFLIGTNSGPMCVALAFGTPCAISNYIPFSIAAPGPNNLFTPKMLYSRTLGRYLTFNEMLAPPFRDANRHHLYRLFDRKLGVRLENNSAEDILAMTSDMFDHLETGVTADPRHRQLAEMCARNDSHYVAKLPPSFFDRFAGEGCLAEGDLAEEFFDRWQHAFPCVANPASLDFVHAPPTRHPPIYDRLR